MENQAPSALQQRFPLSPKKFWKKIIGSLAGFFVFALLLVGFGTVMRGAIVWAMFSALALAYLAYLLLRAWYITVYIRRYFYAASDDFVTIKKGVFAPAEIHVQYQKIQDVYVDQDVIDRIMGLYDVHIASATATSGMEAHIDGVEEAAADGLKSFLLDKMRDGGRPGAAQASAAASPQTSPGPSKPLDAGQMISSEQYPIGSQWLVMQACAAFGHALWITALIALSTFSRSGRAWPISLSLGVLIFIIIFFGHVVYNAIWKNNFRFAFLPDYIKLSTQVIAKSEQHMPYRTIQDVVVKQGIVERLFGLATVSIQNAAANLPAQKSGSSQAINIPGQTPEGAGKIAEIVRSLSLSKSSERTGL